MFQHFCLAWGIETISILWNLGRDTLQIADGQLSLLVCYLALALVCHHFTRPALSSNLCATRKMKWYNLSVDTSKKLYHQKICSVVIFSDLLWVGNVFLCKNAENYSVSIQTLTSLWPVDACVSCETEATEKHISDNHIHVIHCLFSVCWQINQFTWKPSIRAA